MKGSMGGSKSNNVLSGIRDIERIQSEASIQQLELIDDLPMPANNQLLVFRKLDEKVTTAPFQVSENFVPGA